MAQLGARFHGMEEVIGSIPIRSTKQPLQLNCLFADEVKYDLASVWVDAMLEEVDALPRA